MCVYVYVRMWCVCLHVVCVCVRVCTQAYNPYDLVVLSPDSVDRSFFFIVTQSGVTHMWGGVAYELVPHHVWIRDAELFAVLKKLVLFKKHALFTVGEDALSAHTHAPCILHVRISAHGCFVCALSLFPEPGGPCAFPHEYWGHAHEVSSVHGV